MTEADEAPTPGELALGLLSGLYHPVRDVSTQALLRHPRLDVSVLVALTGHEGSEPGFMQPTNGADDAALDG